MNGIIENPRSMRKRIGRMNTIKYIGAIVWFLAFCSLALSEELGTYRLLSISESEKLILVSEIPGKAKFLLDASSAKITLDGNPAEYKSLKTFSLIQLKMERRKLMKIGIALDGVAIEIRINSSEKAS
jgi:hypothetical protein